MVDLIISVTYRMHTTPEWYDPQILDGEGTLEEQICAYEMQRVLKDGLYVADLKMESVGVEFAPEAPTEWCGDEKKHSKHTHFISDVKHQCLGIPTVNGKGREEILIENELDEEDIETPGMPNRCQPIGCDAGFHLPGCSFIEVDKEDPDMPDYVDKEDEDRTEMYPDVVDDRHSED